MKIPQSRIDDLVARPSEGLPVEVKSWIDPATPEGAAKIVRGCLAIRNQNGGFMMFGLNDQTLQVETGGQPANVRDTFHTDKVQQLVSRYAFEPFEIEVAFAERDGIEIPVIVIPDGIQYPVASKADLMGPDNKKLIRVGDVYCRTLNANGRASTAVAQPKDWRDLLDRCFENREADIGRFLRRHLGSSADGLLPLGIKPHVTLQAQAVSFLDEGLNRYVRAASARNLAGVAQEMANGAKFEVALIISPLKTGEMPTATFRQTLASSNPNLTGWPTWLDSAGFRDETARPLVRDGNWEALIVSAADGSWSDHLDFQLFDPNGRFYLLRNLQDDGGGRAPGSVLDPIIAIVRVAEVIAVGLAFARALGWKSQDTTLAFAFRWTKLAGRKLEPWANPAVHISAYERTATDTVNSYVEVPLDTPQSAIAPAVEAVVRQLFVQFGGYQLPSKAIEDWTRKLIERRL
jgi:hypothetical protein